MYQEIATEIAEIVDYSIRERVTIEFPFCFDTQHETMDISYFFYGSTKFFKFQLLKEIMWPIKVKPEFLLKIKEKFMRKGMITATSKEHQKLTVLKEIIRYVYTLAYDRPLNRSICIHSGLLEAQDNFNKSVQNVPSLTTLCRRKINRSIGRNYKVDDVRTVTEFIKCNKLVKALRPFSSYNETCFGPYELAKYLMTHFQMDNTFAMNCVERVMQLHIPKGFDVRITDLCMRVDAAEFNMWRSVIAKFVTPVNNLCKCDHYKSLLDFNRCVNRLLTSMYNFKRGYLNFQQILYGYDIYDNVKMSRFLLMDLIKFVNLTLMRKYVNFHIQILCNDSKIKLAENTVTFLRLINQNSNIYCMSLYEVMPYILDSLNNNAEFKLYSTDKVTKRFNYLRKIYCRGMVFLPKVFKKNDLLNCVEHALANKISKSSLPRKPRLASRKLRQLEGRKRYLELDTSSEDDVCSDVDQVFNPIFDTMYHRVKRRCLSD